MENDIQPEVLAMLLRDHTTGHNIIWATHDYETLGEGYSYNDEITLELITGKNGKVISPRVKKSKEQQSDRVKDMAEVFTPSWVVKKMVDYVDIAIDTRCLELTCGEAPFLVSRYDATTGEPITISERVGVLDRKLRMVINQRLSDEDWLAQMRRAFQSTYGYEWQGDSLLLARENLLYTFIDHYEARFGSKPDVPLLQEFAEIISWNLWQMDGLTYRTPREKSEEPPQAQLSIFDEAPAKTLPPLCKIMDWQENKTIKVNDIKKRQTKNQDIMKFDVIIGNPPYDEDVEGNERRNPIYNSFMDEAYKNADRAMFITPGRFLFNAGQTPKAWNKKMLMNPHFKVVYYNQDASKVFPNVILKGGVSISYYDANKNYEPIEVFVPFSELQSIKEKVISKEYGNKYLPHIMVGAVPYKFSETFRKERPELVSKAGSSFDLRTNAIDNLYETAFFVDRPNDSNEYVQIYGLLNLKRVFAWIRRDYIIEASNFTSYKVLLPKVNGNGEFGETLSSPIVASPMIGYTQSFIGIGAVKTTVEAEAILKYIKTRFVRALLGILKGTQDNPPERWKYVPLQDFTPSSDIDWSKSIAEIDEQLFDKYGLDDKERDFIRTKVKEMA
ncbi:MAG: Eco57I restriction-modification methylase domain-containing protein [Prevotella sp.]|nr:Eco57I restriction-modification methylase domain-containing protein [Prevotella sp.]